MNEKEPHMECLTIVAMLEGGRMGRRGRADVKRDVTREGPDNKPPTTPKLPAPGQ